MSKIFELAIEDIQEVKNEPCKDTITELIIKIKESAVTLESICQEINCRLKNNELHVDGL